MTSLRRIRVLPPWYALPVHPPSCDVLLQRAAPAKLLATMHAVTPMHARAFVTPFALACSGATSFAPPFCSKGVAEVGRG